MTEDTTNSMHPLEELPAYVAGSLGTDAARDVDAHLATCESCQSLAHEWEAIRSATHAEASDAPMPSRGVLDRALAKIDAEEQAPSLRERMTPVAFRRPLFRRTMLGVATAAALAVLTAFTPVGTFAQSLLDVMRPQQFVVVPVTMADLQALPSLSEYGELTQVSKGGPHPTVSADASSAGAATGMTVLTPSYLPATATSAPVFGAIPSQSATFTFSAAKAAAAASKQGKTPPPMPAHIDGSSLQLTTGNAVVAMYGGPAAMLGGVKPAAVATPVVAAAQPTAAAGPLAGLDNLLPQLIVAQMVAPVATASGTTGKELQQYLLAQPGISPELANAVRALGDPTTTWPIPVPLGKLNTHTVSVQGVRGTVFADTSGFATGVLWLKGGIIYAVAAPLSEQEVLRVANSLR